VGRAPHVPRWAGKRAGAAGSTGHIAGGEELAYPGGGPAASLRCLDIGDRDDVEAVAAPELTQRIDRARVAASETEVFPHDDLARTAALDQVFVHELVGFEAVDARVRGGGERRVTPGGSMSVSVSGSNHKMWSMRFFTK